MRCSPRSRALAALFAASLTVAGAAGCGAEDPQTIDAAADRGALPDAGLADLRAPDAGAADLAPDTRPPPCEGQSGTFASQSIEVDGETRHYFLHVPASYSCDAPWPLLVDFHGTAAISGGFTPEEAYGHAELLALADRERFLVVRPRSRSAQSGEWEVYQWDVNPGDVARNVAFTHALLGDLEARYHVDPQRRYASGFSNGTAMAFELLGDAQAQISGFAVVGGGLWAQRALSWSGEAPRVYAVTGYRDYMHTYLRNLTASLDAAGYPAQRLFSRAVDAGHELYGWHWGELWAWLDRGERPPAGTLAAGWTRDASFTAAEDLLAVARAADGALVVSGAQGALYRRPAAGGWSLAARLAPPGQPGEPLTDLCLVGSGRGVVVGHQGTLGETDTAGAAWALRAPLPDYFGQQGSSFGYSYLIGVGCADPGRFVAGGYWAGATSADGAQSWTENAITNYGYNAQVAAVAVSEAGTAVAVGYGGFVGRGAAGGALTHVPLPAPRHWYNDVATAPGGRWWVVGEQGAILRSTDDGRSWLSQPAPLDRDLYAVTFYDDKLGLAVGSHGAALLTTDGSSWQDVSAGVDLYFGDALWLDDQRALVVGEGGAVLTFQR